MAQNGVFVFEADTAAFANRKRAARACLSCQKRKKRCPHTFTKTSDQLADKDGAEKVIPNLTHKEPIHFVGDLNPESILTDLSSRSKGRYSRIGIWVESSRLQQDAIRRELEAAQQAGGSNDGAVIDMAVKQAAKERYAKVERGRRTLTGHQKNYLQAVGAFRVLPKSTQDALITTYIACMDPLLPIIDCKKFLQDYTSGEVSVFLIQAICLVACKTKEAEPYLKLYEDGPLLDPIPFARSLHTGLDAAMKADLEADRFTKIQIMTLMSLHNDGPGGIEESSMHLVQAIHDAQTTGLHIKTPGRTQNDQAAMLWWTLWTLDKFNACLGGRPLMIADRDIDIPRPSIDPHSRSQNMAVWLALGDLLDKVIEFYRPIADPDAAGWEKPFPSFEALTAHCSLGILSESHRSLLEICYNIIGILSCRAGGPTTTSYKRRTQCADRIQQLMAQATQSHLPPLSLVPYAASLSLTVAYRGLRDNHCDPVRVQSDLATRCNVLESLSSVWWTADAMAKLGRKALKSLQQSQANITTANDATKNSAGLGAIGDALEGEVAVCKHGPFDQRHGDPNDLKDKIGMGVCTGGTKGVSPVASAGANDRDIENALHVLSNVAATHGQGSAQSKRAKPNPPTHRTYSSPQVQRLSQSQSQNLNDSLMNGTTADFSFTNMSSPNILGPGTFPVITTPSLDTLEASPPSTTTTGNQPHVTTNNTIDPFTPYDYNPTFFNDLDNLFDGFFDLSMPTMFQDPLFEGAAFDFGTGTGGSMDFTVPTGAYDMSGMSMNNAVQVPMPMQLDINMSAANAGTGYIMTTDVMDNPIATTQSPNPNTSQNQNHSLTPASINNSHKVSRNITSDPKGSTSAMNAQSVGGMLSPTPSPAD